MKNPWDVLKQGANVTVDVPIGSKFHCGRFDLGRFVKAPSVHATYEPSQAVHTIGGGRGSCWVAV